MSNFRTVEFTGKSGVKLVADVGGTATAPRVILLHGGGQTRHSWSETMHALVNDGFHVINYDARGHGESGWAEDGRYALEDFADDLAVVVSHIGGDAVVVGASLGGLTGLYAVGLNATLPVAGLVLVDIVPSPSAAGSERVRQFMAAHPDGFASLDAAADAVAAYNPLRPRPADPAGLMRNLRRRNNGRLYWHWDPDLLTSFNAGDGAEFGSVVRTVADRVEIPTMLIRGMQSDIVDDDGVADLMRFLPQVEIFDVAEAGHMVAGHNNSAFAAAVTRFVERHGKPALDTDV